MSKILVVEDDSDINNLLKKILEKEGYEVSSAFSGTEAELRFSMETYDLILCDLMIPGISGEELIEKIRTKSNVPIIALTAKLDTDDKVNVLELGADDYVTKPFEQRELLARVKVALRRTEAMTENHASKEATMKEQEQLENENNMITYRDLVLNVEARTVTLQGQALDLTGHEFDILQLMMEHPNKVFTKDGIYEAVWKCGYYGEDNTVSVHISNLRKKIGAVTKEEYISTVWGIGYKLQL